MANQKISDMTEATDCTGAELVAVVQSGTTKKAPLNTRIKAYFDTLYARSRVIIAFDTFAGYGSTDNKIPYFTNKNTDVGSSGNLTITSNNATNGLALTINTAGNYAVSFWANYSGVTAHGLSLNSAQLTTDIGAITAANRLGVSTSGSANYSVFVSWVGWLAANDVIRPHTDGTSVGAIPARAGFSISKI